MNLYAASVAVLWNTALHPFAPGRRRPLEDAPRPPGRCAAGERDTQTVSDAFPRWWQPRD